VADEKPRKRLPVLGATSQDEARPRWHWSVIVALGTLFGWLLLEMIAAGPLAEPLAVGGRHTSAAAIHLAALALPAVGAGALAGRVGKRARMIDAVGGAVGLIALVSILAFVRVGAEGLWLVASALAASAAAIGSAIGFALGRRRPAPEA
jgi:hypothetical protein